VRLAIRRRETLRDLRRTFATSRRANGAERPLPYRLEELRPSSNTAYLWQKSRTGAPLFMPWIPSEMSPCPGNQTTALLPILASFRQCWLEPQGRRAFRVPVIARQAHRTRRTEVGGPSPGSPRRHVTSKAFFCRPVVTSLSPTAWRRIVSNRLGFVPSTTQKTRRFPLFILAAGPRDRRTSEKLHARCRHLRAFTGGQLNRRGGDDRRTMAGQCQGTIVALSKRKCFENSSGICPPN